MEAPSLAMIPTGFKDGKLYSVLPESGAGDFDVVRGSGATRVNKEGLVEDVRIVSGLELVTNGDFATDSDWSKGTGWSITGGAANCDGTQTSQTNLIQNFLALGTGKIFKITFQLKDYQAGKLAYVNLTGTGTLDFENINANGTYTAYSGLSTGDNFITFRADADFIGSIDNISVKEVTEDTDIPRLDYTDGGCPVLLVEPQSTNLIPYSEDFSSGNWFEYNETSATIDASQSNPSGANGSYKIEGLSGLGRFGLSSISVTPSTVYSLSFYVKNIDATFLKVNLGTSNSPSSYTYTSEVNASDWSRVSVNFTTGAAVTSMQLQILRDLPVGESVYIWGAQLEELTYATSYIPTSGAVATRLADSVTGAGDATTFNSTEGVLYVEMAAIADTGVFEVISLSDGSASNIVAVLYRNTANGFTAVVNSGGATSLSKTITLADATDFIKVAVSYKLNEFKLYVNGVLEFTDTSGNAPVGLNTLQMTDSNGTSNKFKGKVKDLRVFNTALTDAELLTLTTI